MRQNKKRDKTCYVQRNDDQTNPREMPQMMEQYLQHDEGKITMKNGAK